MAIAEDLAMALDPARFARAAGYEPDWWQADVLRSEARHLCILACRQSGKSLTTALRALWVAIYEPGSLVLITAAAQRQSSELFQKVLAAYRGLGRPVPAEAESRLTLELEGGSRIIALPGRTDATLRGYSAPRLIICDEAARQPEELLQGLRPMLATNPRGQLIMLSTPWGKSGAFYEAWTGAAGWERVGPITGEDCPRIDPAFLAAERASIPDVFYRSEWCCEFTETIDQVFRHEDIMAALSADVAPLFGAA
jgi:hypothetical protein